MSEDTERVLAAQAGRPLGSRNRVVSRCHLELPVVLEVEPDQDGEPFPTLYWLTCPLAKIRVSRLEQEGWVRDLTARVDSDPALASALDAAHRSYAARRAELVSPGSVVADRLAGGVGGSTGAGLKCLHAHYAHARAGGENPIGEAVRVEVEPLDCETPCVVDGERNPRWRRP